MYLTKSMVNWLIEKGHCVEGGSDDYYKFNTAQLLANDEISPDEFKQISGEDHSEFDQTSRFKSLTEDLNGTLQEMKNILEKEDGGDSMNAEKLFTGRTGGSIIRVKDASEQLSEKRYAAKNKFGQNVFDPVYGRECLTQSDAAKAKAGVLFKHLANKSGLGVVLSEYERNLLDEMAMKETWAGTVNGEYSADIQGGRGVKALIDDSPSGGIEINPIFFDSDVVTFPLLTGELFPQVDLHEVPRGRRIESGSIGTPTMSWGGFDDSAMPLFNTASMVAALDTTIFVINCSVLIGRDFMADSPVQVGQVLTELVGMRLQAELDKVIASGDGTTQPEGLSNASGLTTVNPSAGTSGPPTVGDYYNLMFAVGKQYRNAQYNPVFISNDTTYQRSRQVKVDASGADTDVRSALDPLMSNQGGTLANSYSTLGWGHKVQNDLGNSTAFFAAMKKYRMYRRIGLDLRFEQAGYTLARQNEVLLVARARFGGRLMDSNACAKWTSGQS